MNADTTLSLHNPASFPGAPGYQCVSSAPELPVDRVHYKCAQIDLRFRTQNVCASE